MILRFVAYVESGMGYISIRGLSGFPNWRGDMQYLHALGCIQWIHIEVQLDLAKGRNSIIYSNSRVGLRLPISELEEPDHCSYTGSGFDVSDGITEKYCFAWSSCYCCDRI